MGRVKQYIAVFAVIVATTMPAWARNYMMPLTVDKSAAIGGTELKAGDYELMADGAKSELQILLKGKVVATVQGHWVKLPQKTLYSSVATDGDKITEVQFGGSEQAFDLQ